MTTLFNAVIPSLTELKALSLAIRRNPRIVNHDAADSSLQRRPDTKLLKIMGAEFNSIEDTHQRLNKAASYLRQQNDRRAVFLTVYAVMTSRVGNYINAGKFNDPTWVREYLISFANRYRRTLVAFELSDLPSVPRVWRTAFNASLGDKTLYLQDALLGINAHINYDLPYTLQDVDINPAREQKFEDHTKINEVLQELVDVVQEILVKRYSAAGYQYLDTLFGSLDEALTLMGLKEARSLAWRNAVLLTDTRSDIAQRLLSWRIRTIATGVGYSILAPTADRGALQSLRDIESNQLSVDTILNAFDAYEDKVTTP